jgi:hypothetical protein
MTAHPASDPAEAAPMRRQPWRGDFSGAFADGAVLFPLLLALAWQTGGSAAVMLATTGVAYLAAGWLFRLPIPVQPLKSLAITAIAVGASLAEIRVAGALLALVFLAIALANVNRLARLVPAVIVHGIQLGLGVILLLKALALIGFAPLPLAAVAAAILAILALTRVTGRPVLGGVALASLLWGLWQATPGGADAAATAGLRPWVVAMLVVPQIALSLTNAVLGTQRTAEAYFGSAAGRVTPRRLLGSLGFGNLAVAAVGGLPYCHGSGGLTAHVHGGSRSEGSNAVIGIALIAMGLVVHLGGGGLPAYPAGLQAILLGTVGVLHLKLAAPSWRTSATRPVLVIMGAAALVTQNMLAVLVAGSALLALRHYRPWGLAARPTRTGGDYPSALQSTRKHR